MRRGHLTVADRSERSSRRGLREVGSPSCFGVMASKGARFEGLQVSLHAPEGYRRKVGQSEKRLPKSGYRSVSARRSLGR